MSAVREELHQGGHLLHAERYSVAQRRSIDAAMELFAEHGVKGTSFQMVAEAVGVTKAAIYHQFKSKSALVLAVAEVGLSRLEEALVLAEAQPSRDEARAFLLTGVIDLAVDRRQWVHALQGDPVMVRAIAAHPPFLELMTRVYGVLLGDNADAEGEVRIAIVSAAIGGAIVHPVVAGLDDETLRRELLAVTRRLFDIKV